MFNGTLELGLEVDASGSPTIDMDNFELTYCGNDREGYMKIMKGMLEEAKADTLVMVSGADDLPGFNNLGAYRRAIDAAESLEEDASAGRLIEVVGLLDAAMKEYDGIVAEYKVLRMLSIVWNKLWKHRIMPSKTVSCRRWRKHMLYMKARKTGGRK